MKGGRRLTDYDSTSATDSHDVHPPPLAPALKALLCFVSRRPKERSTPLAMHISSRVGSYTDSSHYTKNRNMASIKIASTPFFPIRGDPISPICRRSCWFVWILMAAHQQVGLFDERQQRVHLGAQLRERRARRLDAARARSLPRWRGKKRLFRREEPQNEEAG